MPARAEAVARVLACAGALSAAMAAQGPSAVAPIAGDAAAPVADDLLSAYLDRPGLRGLLAEQLTQRIRNAPADQRPALAERLGRVYIELMGQATTPAERERWERAASDLARIAPDAQSLELRIDLLRSAYTLAEERAERTLLRVPAAGDEDPKPLVVAIRDLKARFALLGTEAQRRADGLQRAEQSGRGSERQVELLADARRLRSSAYYYAGWSSVYVALLERDTTAADEALRDFGVIVNGPGQAGRAALLDRLSRGFLKYEHVARAAIGCALALSVRGDDINALRWLDEIAAVTDLAPGVRAQLPSRRLTVLAGAKRWPEVERLVRDKRGDPAKSIALDTAFARLLAVAVAENEAGAHAEIRTRLGRWAVEDLIARGALDQVADLVTTFPSLPLGDSGFVPKYIRGMRAFEVARREHAGAGLGRDAVATDAALINRWREAAGLLTLAGDDPAAAARPRERAAAALAAGRSLLLAGDAAAAGERFLIGYKAAADAPQREELLWAAAVAFDQAVRGGGTSVQARLDEVVALYIRENPGSPRAAELLVRRGSAPGLDDEQALAILLAVPRDASVYDSARRQAVRLMYRQFRAAAEGERGFLAGKLAPIAEDSLAMDRRAALAAEATPEAARAAAERAILTGRQMLDVILAASEPDVRRAEAVLGVIELLAAHTGAKIDEARAELAFRRLQIAQAQGDEQRIASAITILRGMGDEGGRFVEAAERSAFQLAVRRWQRGSRGGQGDADAARGVLAAGRVLLLQIARGGDPRALRNNAVVSVHRVMAEAATQLGQAGDAAACQAAIDFDQAVLEVRPADSETLTRLAINNECIGAPLKAVEMWTRLMESAEGGSPAWFRARTESLRLLVPRDPAAAAAAFAQLRVLYPTLGPEPYRTRLRELEAQLPAAAGGAPP